MESSESHEPSYYEVALTNRQVLIAFVVLLTSIVAAFLSGVWIGRGGSTPPRPTAGITEASAATEPPLEQLTFFNGKEAGARTPPAGASAPAAAAPAPGAKRDTAAPPTSGPMGESTAESSAEESATEAMRQNLDATMAANRTVPPPVAPANVSAAADGAPAGTRSPAQSAPPAAVPPKPAASPAREAATKPVATKPSVAGKTFVQVYSSTNATRAKEIVAQLRKAGFAVVVAETPKSGATNHRVRVGPYAERTKADAAAVRLRREFRLETWVTDSP